MKQELTYDMVEEGLQIELENAKDPKLSDEERTNATERAIKLGQLLVTIDKDNADYYDKQERRRIEEERNKLQNEVESNKQKITFGRAAFEIGKIVVPLVLQIAAFSGLQGRMFKFEETGRITSTGGKEMHLPRFWK